jgi:hypothetical protein
MFDIMEEVSLCYNDYARRKGFSIRIRTSRRLQNFFDKVLFACNKEGKCK